MSDWAIGHAKRIVKDAADYCGRSWQDMSGEMRERACASGLVGLLIAQDQQYPDTLANLQKVAGMVHTLVNPR